MRTVERKRELPFRETGGPTRAATRDFEVYFSTARAASYAITVRLGRPQRQRLLAFADYAKPSEVVEDVLACLDDFGGGRVEELHRRIKDEAYFNNFAALAKKLSPDGERVRTVGFTSVKGDEKHVVTLTGPPTSVWKPRVESGTKVEYIGRIRAADETSKKRSHPVFRVETDAGVVSPPIRVAPGLLQDVVKPFWGELVKVIASKPKKGGPNMIEIESIEGQAAQNSDADTGTEVA
ncbi:MAG: hypothetical protein HY000_31080 [Planctomycetes bacterium]|nr:hypothetical protein [Planctomycetota bacterium]